MSDRHSPKAFDLAEQVQRLQSRLDLAEAGLRSIAVIATKTRNMDVRAAEHVLRNIAEITRTVMAARPSVNNLTE